MGCERMCERLGLSATPLGGLAVALVRAIPPAVRGGRPDSSRAAEVSPCSSGVSVQSAHACASVGVGAMHVRGASRVLCRACTWTWTTWTWHGVKATWVMCYMRHGMPGGETQNRLPCVTSRQSANASKQQRNLLPGLRWHRNHRHDWMWEMCVGHWLYAPQRAAQPRPHARTGRGEPSG